MRTAVLLTFAAALTVLAKAQTPVSLSGLLTESDGATPLAYANAVVRTLPDSSFLIGTVSGDDGRYTLEVPGGRDYLLEFSFLGYRPVFKQVYVGTLSPNLALGTTPLSEDAQQLAQVEVTGQASEVSSAMDRKSYAVDDNIAQTGGSVLQAMQNLPGVTIDNGSVALRGSDKVVVLIDGKQTALTGFGKATGLDNLPASAIERIEVINNPGARYDAQGNAGIINIITRKERRAGLNGKVGMTGGLGSLWEREANLPGIRPQYRLTPKLNPTASLNYRTDKYNLYFQGDYLYTETLNKNEFATRIYDNGETVVQQLKRNRNTHFTTVSAGIDYTLSQNNTLTFSGLFGSEKIIDRGDQPFFNANLSERLRLWQFLEDELKTTAMATAKFAHAFADPGHTLGVGLNYTFHREDERYFYDNTLESSTGTDAFKLLSDEQVLDFTTDYVRPLKAGRLETGVKLRRRVIPTNMDFQPGRNSVLDSTAGGAATYAEWIPAAYATYVYETSKWEAELGLRAEYVQLKYTVN